jgi:hypothetical protein
MKYNGPTLRNIVDAALTIIIVLIVCFVVVISHERPPRPVYPSTPFDVKIMVAPSGTTDARAVNPVIQGRLNERFAVTFPKGLRVGTLDYVTVQIAANTYETLLEDIDEYNRKVLRQTFKGYPRLEVTLNADSGLELVKHHSDDQVVVKGQPHREWSWTVVPKTTGRHQLILLVQGVHGNIREDYDPEIEEYEVAFSFWYWLSNGLQQNGINWVWAVIFAALSFLAGWLVKERKRSDK